MSRWRWALIIAVAAGGSRLLAADIDFSPPSMGAPVPYSQAAMGQPLPAPQPVLAASTVVPDPQAGPLVGETFRESSWYMRLDYFHWNEQIHGADFVNESGLLTTLGYVHRTGPERYRAELFWGSMDYDGYSQSAAGNVPLGGTTDYIGCRAEFDILLEPLWLPDRFLVLGIGTRFWIRDLKDGIDASGAAVTGYQEFWWTVYPYIGLERKRTLSDGAEFYGSARFGLTPLTYEHAIGYDAGIDVALHPRLGVMTQAEFGFRGRHLFLAGFIELMSWSHSGVVRGMYQPDSELFTAGLKGGWSF